MKGAGASSGLVVKGASSGLVVKGASSGLVVKGAALNSSPSCRFSQACKMRSISNE